MSEDIDFVECPTCAAKPGSPSLCESCQVNRTGIFTLKHRLDEALLELDQWKAHTITLLRIVERLLDEGP